MPKLGRLISKKENYERVFRFLFFFFGAGVNDSIFKKINEVMWKEEELGGFILFHFLTLKEENY